MQTENYCRTESVESHRLSQGTPDSTESRMLRDIAQSWLRLANQIERYASYAKRRPELRTAERSPRG